jgi:hypothetical protein
VEGIPELVEVTVLWVLQPEFFLTHHLPELNALEVASAVVLNTFAIGIEGVFHAVEVASFARAVRSYNLALISLSEGEILAESVDLSPFALWVSWTTVVESVPELSKLSVLSIFRSVPPGLNIQLSPEFGILKVLSAVLNHKFVILVLNSHLTNEAFVIAWAVGNVNSAFALQHGEVIAGSHDVLPIAGILLNMVLVPELVEVLVLLVFLSVPEFLLAKLGPEVTIHEVLLAVRLLRLAVFVEAVPHAVELSIIASVVLDGNSAFLAIKHSEISADNINLIIMAVGLVVVPVAPVIIAPVISVVVGVVVVVVVGAVCITVVVVEAVPESVEVSVVSVNGPEWLHAHFSPEEIVLEVLRAVGRHVWVFGAIEVLTAGEASVVTSVVCNVEDTLSLLEHVEISALSHECLILARASVVTEVIQLPEVVEVSVLWVLLPPQLFTHHRPELHISEVLITVFGHNVAVVVESVDLTNEVISHARVVAGSDLALALHEVKVGAGGLDINPSAVFT